MPEHTIAENLSRLITAKTDIANAITTMGGTVGQNDGFEEFATDIATIPSSSVEPLSFTLLPDVFTFDQSDLLTSIAYAYRIPLDAGLNLYVFGASGKILTNLSNGAHFIEFDISGTASIAGCVYLRWKKNNGTWSSYNEYAQYGINNGKGYGATKTNLDNNYSFCGGGMFIMN